MKVELSLPSRLFTRLRRDKNEAIPHIFCFHGSFGIGIEILESLSLHV